MTDTPQPCTPPPPGAALPPPSQCVSRQGRARLAMQGWKGKERGSRVAWIKAQHTNYDNTTAVMVAGLEAIGGDAA